MTELLAQRGPGRPCGICQSRHRAAIEEAMATGTMISSISSEYGIARASIRAHGSRHMIWTREQLHEAGLDLVPLTSRLADLAERMRDAALEAENAGRHADHVRATDAERRALLALAALGVTHEQQVAQMEEQAIRLKAITRAVRLSPELAAKVAVELDGMDERAAAKQLRQLFHETKEVTAS